MSDNDLQKYFMEQTNSALSDLKTDVKLINSKLDSFADFKTHMTQESKIGATIRSTIVSGVLGAITLAASLGVEIYLGRQERSAIIQAALIEVRTTHNTPGVKREGP